MNSSYRILVVEDEPRIAALVCDNLEAEDYNTLHAADGEAALRATHAGGIDLILLDVMLPGMDGFEVCRRLRAEGNRLPILFLTARDLPQDRVEGLKTGGDDYLVKPFHLDELLARVDALLRRSGWGESPRTSGKVEIGKGLVDFSTFEATGADGSVETLSNKEIGILKLLREAHGAVITRDEILDNVWGEEAEPTPRTIDNFIVRLRKKFETDASSPEHILTVRGKGYRLN